MSSVKPKVWTEQESKSLISVYKEFADNFSDHSKKVSDIWESISNRLKDFNIQKTGSECDKKWRNLKGTFKRIYCDTERTEQSKFQWELYEDLLDVMLQDKILRRAAPIVSVPKIVKAEREEAVHFYTIDSNNLDIDTVENQIYKTTKVYGSSRSSDRIILHEQPPSKRIHLDVVNQSDPEKFIDVVYELQDVVEEGQPDSTEITQEPPELSFIDPQALSNVELQEEEHEVQEILDEENDQEKSINQIDDDEPPMWMQTFLLRYDTDMKLIQEKLNKISEKQELHFTTLQHLSRKITKLESSNNNFNKKQS